MVTPLEVDLQSLCNLVQSGNPRCLGWKKITYYSTAKCQWSNSNYLFVSSGHEKYCPKIDIVIRDALSWEQTARFQQFNVQRNSVCVYFCSGNLALEHVALAKCKENQT